MKLRREAFARGAALLLATLLLPAGICASAADGETAEETRFEENSWEELVEALVQEVGGSEKTVALGYCNTVTGETHFYNGDSYFVGASLYKAPLNMYYAERIALGEASWDDEINNVPYRDAQVSSLTYSSNPVSERMVALLGGWAAYRADIAEYVGEDALDEDYIGRHHSFTARQMTACMTLLATQGERFPNVTQCLLDSAPGLFLEYADVPFEIAQKYGNVGSEKLFHAAGIVYTDEPIALAVLTRGLGDQRGLMAGYTQLMCDYTQHFTPLRLAREAAEEQAAAEAAAQKAAEEAAAQKAAEETAAQKAAEEAAARKAAEDEARRLAADNAAQQSARLRRWKLTGAVLLLCCVLLFAAAFFLTLRRRIPGGLVGFGLTLLGCVLLALALWNVALRLSLPTAAAVPNGVAAGGSPAALISRHVAEIRNQTLEELIFRP